MQPHATKAEQARAAGNVLILFLADGTAVPCVDDVGPATVMRAAEDAHGDPVFPVDGAELVPCEVV